jgi:hypothetical protein
MDLQAIRYAAMVSAMTFERVVELYADHLRRMGKEADARAEILEFLGWGEDNEEMFGQDVRIILVSAEFSKELTTAVIWLNLVVPRRPNSAEDAVNHGRQGS